MKRKEAYPLNSEKRQNLNNKLVKWIVKRNKPLSVVEETEFREMMEEADPKWTLPARKTISKQIIPNLYQDVEKKLAQDLQAVEFLALTTDM